jgi:hypothetical protein
VAVVHVGELDARRTLGDVAQVELVAREKLAAIIARA